MYTFTFYSFKGGVGRTMALVNVAAELVKLGRKVLVVDFDLEAPGLETYKQLVPEKAHVGVVEYVMEFVRSRQVPDITKFVFKAKGLPTGARGGKGELWVMPAGRRDPMYRQMLINLDWKRLYLEMDGFRFFEETKKAWEDDLKLDYVLIDSRTGDTDVLGICTRQLPNSVVLLFTPNEQNLAGLENVVRDIRREKEGLPKIRLHFVAANVPNLDDETQILRQQLRKFRKRLGFVKLSGVIRRYESLELLDQQVFVLDRPDSRLARSYKKLTEELVKDNPADRDGVLRKLQDSEYKPEPQIDSLLDLSLDYTLGQLRTSGLIAKGLDEHLRRASGDFLDDPEVLELVAKGWMSQYDFHLAEGVLNRILKLDPDRSGALFLRAQCRRSRGRLEESADDFLAYVGSHERDRDHINRALSALMELAPGRLDEAVEHVVSAAPNEELFEYSNTLNQAEAGVPFAARLLRKLLAGANAGIRGEARDELRSGNDDRMFEALFYARCWPEIIELYGELECEELDAVYLFFLIAAHWALDGSPPQKLCRHALNQADSFREVEIWFLWGAGDKPEATAVLDDLDKVARGLSLVDEGFSSWSMRRASKERLLDDLSNVRRMFQGEPLRPAYLGPDPS